MDIPVPPPDPSKLAASLLAADLAAQPADMQATLRYLYGRVAIDWGLLEIIGVETRPEGDRLVCRSVEDGALRSVDRPRELAWTMQEEDQFVTELKAILNQVARP